MQTTVCSLTLKLGNLRSRQRHPKFALGDLETVVLRELWESKKSLSVKELRLMMPPHRQVAITTVATILDRLYRKGIVLRRLIKDGAPHYVYSAKFTEKEFKHAIVDNVMHTLLHSYNDVTIAYLANKMAEEENDHALSKYLDKLKIRVNK